MAETLLRRAIYTIVIQAVLVGLLLFSIAKASC